MNTTKTAPQVVDQYGVHLSRDGLWWLVQDDGDQQNARDLKIKAPMVLRPKPRGFCPHNLSVGGRPSSADNSFADTLARNALTRAFLPIPQAADPQAFFIEETDPHVASALVYLRRITGVRSYPWFQLTQKATRLQAHISNISPHVVYGATVNWLSKEGQMLECFRGGSRPLVVTGDPDCVVPSWMTRVTDVNFKELLGDFQVKFDMKELGDDLLKSWMREEYELPEFS